MMPPGSLEQVVFRMDALHRVVAAGIPVLNPPRAVEAAVDKYLTLSLLDQAGISVPATWAGESASMLWRYSSRWGVMSSSNRCLDLKDAACCESARPSLRGEPSMRRTAERGPLSPACRSASGL